MRTHLERIEVGITLERQLVFDPIARAQVLCIEPHKEHRVQRVNDSVADPTGLREVGAFVTDWVV